MNPSSPDQRKKERLAELLANAKSNLIAKGIIKDVPISNENLLAQSSNLSNEKILAPIDVQKPNRSQADIEREFKEAKTRVSNDYHEKARILHAEAEAKLAAELAEIEKSRPQFIWNEEQQASIDLAEIGEDLCLIGKAGTGKTTVVREGIIKNLLKKGIIGPLREDTKYLRAGLPGIVVVSFTNRAVKNIARGMSDDMKQHTMTVHKLLEFKPTYIPIRDAQGNDKTIMRFLPSRNSLNPLPNSLKLIIFEESSMISTELFDQLMNAIPHHCQMIFLGDLQQLPPVYGSAILGFKLNEFLPTPSEAEIKMMNLENVPKGLVKTHKWTKSRVIELNKIYRQAEGSPIIALAWRIASGDIIEGSEFEKITKESGGKITLRPWKKRLDTFDALHIMNLLFKSFIDAKVYDPSEDMIMIPFNKSFGTVEFNKNLAQYLGKKRGAVVHEIIAGFQKHYFAIGDKVLCDRQEAIIEDIHINDQYQGVMPIKASNLLNRWGMYEVEGKEAHETTQHDLDEVEAFLLQQVASKKDEDEEAKRQASHILVCRLIDSDEIMEIRTTGEFSACIFAYALTVHKCQGSEWRKCFLLLHHSHAVMNSRELLYTAVTRAREELIVMCDPDALKKGIRNQRIKGNSIAEKAEFFKGKLEKEL